MIHPTVSRSPSRCHNCWPGRACRYGCKQGSYHHSASKEIEIEQCRVACHGREDVHTRGRCVDNLNTSAIFSMQFHHSSGDYVEAGATLASRPPSRSICIWQGWYWAFTSRFFIKPPPEPHEPWTWCSSFWEPRAWLATVPARSGPAPAQHRVSTGRQSCRRHGQHN